jgi:hypothetical protein
VHEWTGGVGLGFWGGGSWSQFPQEPKPAAVPMSLDRFDGAASLPSTGTAYSPVSEEYCVLYCILSTRFCVLYCVPMSPSGAELLEVVHNKFVDVALTRACASTVR